MDGWKKYLFFCCSVITLIGLIICLTYWFEVKEDKILIKHCLSSYNKQYRSSFKTRIIMINDINSIDVRDFDKTIIINLNNNNSICFQIGGYFNRSEIIQLFYEVKKQINKT